MIDIQLMQNTSEIIIVWLVLMALFVTSATIFIIVMHKRVSDLYKNRKR